MRQVGCTKRNKKSANRAENAVTSEGRQTDADFDYRR